MDELAKLILRRVACCFHPYIPQNDGWRRYPPHIARMLEYIEPLHVIAVSPTLVGVDGICVEDARGMYEKYKVAVEALESVFGEVVEKVESGNMALGRLSTGLWLMSYFRGSVWFAAVCADVRPYPSRFAFLAEPQVPCAPNSSVSGAKVTGLAATVDGAKVYFRVSWEFFNDPLPEKAELFGDLLFLAQMGGGWVVDKEISADVWRRGEEDPYKYLAHVLVNCPGLKSFVNHSYREALLRDSHEEGFQRWRRVVEAIDAAQKQS